MPLAPDARGGQSGIRGGDELGDVTVRDGNTFGHAGGAGGVDQVGDVIGGGHGQCGVGLGCHDRVVDVDHRELEAADAVREVTGSDHRDGRGVGEHEFDTGHRQRRIERQVRRPGLEHRQDRHDGFRGPWQQQCHSLPRTGAVHGEQMRELGGPPIEFAVGQAVARAAERLRVRSARDDRGEQFRDRHVRSGPVQCRAVGEGLEARVLGVVEQLDAGHRRGGIGADRGEDASQPFDQCLDGRGIEDVGAIFDGARDAGGCAVLGPALAERERQIHSRGLGIDRDGRHRQVAERQSGSAMPLLSGEVLPRQQHLHQRVVRQATGGVEPLDQYLERHVLVLVGREAALLHLGQQVGERGVTGQVDTQDQRVDEEAHQVVERRVGAARDREAHGHIGTRAERGQQHGQGGLHHHESGGVVFPCHLRDLLLQFGRPVDGDGRAVLIRHQRVGAIGRQLQPFGQPRQGVLPIVELCRDRAVAVVQIAELRALPQRVVDVLHRQLGPLRFQAGAPACVGDAQVTRQRRDGPAVGRDVMHRGHQDVLVVGNPEQAGSQRNVGGDVEGVPRRAVHGGVQPVRGPAGRIDALPPDVGGARRQHHLLRYPVRRDEHRAQRLVPAHDIDQRGVQRVGVEVTGQTQHGGEVVGRGRALQLLQEPQAILRERQRKHGRPHRIRNGHQRVPPHRGCADPRRQFRDGRRLEHRAHRQVGVECGVDRGDQAHRGDAVAAEIEERIIHADAAVPQQVREDAGQDFLDRGRRRPVVTHHIVRRGQRARVQLAVGGQRQAVQRHDRRGHHVPRDPSGECGPGRGRVDRAGHVPDQTLVTRPVFTGDHHGLPHTVQRGQSCLHIAEFDAVAADLDLFVSATQVRQLTVGTPAHQVAGAIHPLPRRPERACHEPRCAQPGAAQIADTHTRTGDIELTDHPGRHRPQRTVEHEQRRAAHRRTDRHHSGFRHRLGRQRCADRDAHRRLGRSVGIDHDAAVGRPTAHHLGRAGLTHRDERGVLQSGRRQYRCGRWGLGQDRDALGHQGLPQVRRRPGDIVADHHDAAAAQQRPEDLPHRHVECERVGVAPHPGSGQARVESAEQLGHIGVREPDALGHTRGARRIDQVGERTGIRQRRR
ncbi:Uncharacterised protein [Mycobacteroides abscessus subsp. abscessus]|nr:Uncharacterised protein [Mycobacteroides abscessus subsp. abscessus]